MHRQMTNERPSSIRYEGSVKGLMRMTWIIRCGLKNLHISTKLKTYGTMC